MELVYNSKLKKLLKWNYKIIPFLPEKEILRLIRISNKIIKNKKLKKNYGEKIYSLIKIIIYRSYVLKLNNNIIYKLDHNLNKYYSKILKEDMDYIKLYDIDLSPEYKMFRFKQQNYLNLRNSYLNYRELSLKQHIPKEDMEKVFKIVSEAEDDKEDIFETRNY